MPDGKERVLRKCKLWGLTAPSGHSKSRERERGCMRKEKDFLFACLFIILCLFSFREEYIMYLCFG